MNKINLKLYPEVTYKDLIRVLKSMNFVDESTENRFVYTYTPLDAKMILPLPQSPNDKINKAHLWGNAFILEEKGVISSVDALYKIIEHQKFYEENVLV